MEMAEQCKHLSPFVLCAKGKHGGELSLIPPLALSKLHLRAKERGKERKVRSVNWQGKNSYEKDKIYRGGMSTEKMEGTMEFIIIFLLLLL